MAKTISKSELIQLLNEFINQRPQLNWADYGDNFYYNQDKRLCTRQLNDAREMLRAIDWRESITVEDMLDKLGGRLTLTADNKLDYCTGQYWSTEYRAAVCLLCSQVLWDYYREPGMDADDIRKCARDEFGRGLASRWFN